MATALMSFLAALFTTRFMIWVNISDTPDHRSSHDVVTPRGGGVGIIVGFCFCMAYFFSKNQLAHIPHWKLVIMVAALMGIGAVSLLDDIKGVALRYKLLTQIFGGVLHCGRWIIL